jgi:hypothetical protein
MPPVLPPVSLPPSNDIPEEVLRAEVITGARSPIDNQPMTATAYSQLEAEIAALNETPGTVSPKLRDTIQLLRLRKFLKTVLPFLPIK